MKKTLLPITASLALLLTACGGKDKKSSVFPDNFDKIGDAGRMDYMMKHVSPDSVARFVIDAALGRVPGARIDTMALATSYAYDRYKGDDLENFSLEYEQHIGSLSLSDKMKAYKLGGSEDLQRLGYHLGLEYLGAIREGNMKVADVDRDLQEFRKACGTDTATYSRFLIGFRTVLRMDKGVDVPKDIYLKYAE